MPRQQVYVGVSMLLFLLSLYSIFVGFLVYFIVYKVDKISSLRRSKVYLLFRIAFVFLLSFISSYLITLWPGNGSEWMYFFVQFIPGILFFLILASNRERMG